MSAALLDALRRVTVEASAARMDLAGGRAVAAETVISGERRCEMASAAIDRAMARLAAVADAAQDAREALWAREGMAPLPATSAPELAA